jgi:uncharacterized protein YjbJ (UPF0337 family)
MFGASFNKVDSTGRKSKTEMISTDRFPSSSTELLMNEDKIKGQWKQIAGKLKERWGKLTDDDLKIANGNSEYLAGRIQERYGVARDEAQKQIKEFDGKL